MKILVLNGSPKREKSDTMHITRVFLVGMKDAAPQEVNIVNIIDSHIEFCTGCFTCKRNDKLVLKREDNKFDDKAIMIFTESGKKLGYVPEKDNVIFSRLMDAGKLLIARITSIKKRSESYTQIGIDIFLVDF